MKHSPSWFGLTLLLTITTGAAAPFSDATINRLVADYLSKRPGQGYDIGLSQADALATQRAFVAKLTPKLGKPAGHKVGLVTKEAQQRFGATSPVRGVLLSKMLLKNGAEVPAKFGTRPICEADLLVEVKDVGINSAATPWEAAWHLKSVIAFIELPDGILSTNQPMNGNLLTAINAGARLGVVGQRIQVKPTLEFVEALATMTVIMSDQTGAELGRARGDLILDNPLNAVVWLVKELNASGEKLKPGDLLSLGSLKNIIPQSGQTITVRYEGLPGGPIQASVRFK